MPGLSSSPDRLRLHLHIPGLDLLRGLAVAGVVIFHAYANGGYVRDLEPGPAGSFVRLTILGKQGVYLFFVLSGFLITSILLRQREQPRFYRDFYVRRALRILPVYLLLLAVLAAFHLVHWRFVLACLLFIANMAKLVGSSATEYGALWTLAVEEQFYLLWPTFVRRARDARSLLAVIAAGCVAAPLCRLGLSLRGIGTYLLLPTNIDALLFGALCAVLIAHGFIHAGNIRRIYGGLLLAGFVFLVPYVKLLSFAGAHGPVFWSVFDAVGRYDPLCFFVAGVLSSVRAAQTADGSRPTAVARFLIFLGYISYGLYLVHPLLFSCYDRLAAGTALAGFHTGFPLLTVRFLVVSTASVAVAALSRRYFEQLFLERKTALAPYKGDQPQPRPLRTSAPQPRPEPVAVHSRFQPSSPSGGPARHAPNPAAFRQPDVSPLRPPQRNAP